MIDCSRSLYQWIQILDDAEVREDVCMCVPDVSARLFGLVRVFSLSLCCLPTVMYIRTARFPLSGSLGGFEGSSGQST
jgi:hypothetical protein